MKSSLLAFLVFLSVSPVTLAQGMPRAEWLANLRSGVGPFLCAPQSPLMRVYKESVNTCPATVESLFDKCTNEVLAADIPQFLTSVNQANRQGQIIAECISAHYMGGAALESFLLLQKLSAEKKSGG